MDTLIGTDPSVAAEHLTNGEAVAIPTETVYGLAANALEEAAVMKIFLLKERPVFDPLIVHIESIDRLPVYAEEIPPSAYLLAKTFWPGPLTLILKKKSLIPDLVTSGLDTVGLRVPSHPLTIQLLEQLPFPLAAPSANPFGYVSPTTAHHVADQFHGKIPYILDGGPCRVGIESTIVGFDEQGRPVIYRQGGIALRDVEAVAGAAKLMLSTSSNPKAPGMMKSHYAPKIPLVCGDMQSLAKVHRHKKCALLCLTPPGEIPQNIVTVVALSPSEDLQEAARHFFSSLRTLEQSGADLIIAEWMPDRDLGPALNDRLRRAAAANEDPS